ncbi:MAG: UDP-N-acetylmuramoyl-L-alanyl-D-glutamate--2,6-diaminopimelate ligase [Clostridia bacterium]|nr:UDP-N-acetylmuramoyl-L-alanyl-D-glutamate--2,6-diaminopimelate ligase [Clostridia bacterium]
MLLSKVFQNVNYRCPDFRDVEIDDIVYSSRNAAEGTMFVALVGAFSDGHDYAESAYLLGARVFLLSKEVSLPEDALCIYVDNTRETLAHISGNFFSHPDKEIDVIGVTGTKGKTTVTHMLCTCLNECGIKSGVIGTVGAYFDGKYIPTVNTTPESYEIQKLLRLMADAGCKAACIEVSSIGIKNHRVDGIDFSTAVFTNLSPDHIGGAEHDSFEEYSFWKKQLFKKCKKAIFNKDDLFSEEIIKEITVPFATFSINEDADFSADDIKNLRTADFFGVGFTYKTKDGSVDAKIAMPGFYSVYNALAAVSVCKEYSIADEKIVSALEKARVKGRNELMNVGASYAVIIDYAHNGQSFNSVIDTVKEYPHERIICVYGSVGDRAQLRRQEMGLVCGKKADLSVITTDDPGFEDPEEIAKEIASFVEKEGGEYKIIVDRTEAVHFALSEAKDGDIVLILGKGHETIQKIKGEKVHYSDHEAVKAYFEKSK